MRGLRNFAMVAALGAGALALAGCGRAGRPDLPNGHRPQMVTPPNAVAAPKEPRPYGDKWNYPQRHGVFKINPPPPHQKKPDRPFFLDFLL